LTISVFGSDMGDLEKEYVSKCLDSQWIGFGEKVSEFENELCRVRNFSNFTMLDSGSNSLFLALYLLKLPKNSEVILPAFTWMACANAVVLAGLRPVFADVELDTMNISVDTIKQVVTKNTSCIMVVHFAGLPVDMDPIIKLGYPVVEDAAHAIYSDYKSLPCGSIGDLGIFSFDAVKNLAVGEGGGIVCKNMDSKTIAQELRYCGIRKSGFQAASSSGTSDTEKMWWEYELTEPFMKMLPTNIAASIGLAQLERRNELQKKRKKIWQVYQESFNNLDFLYTPKDELNYEYTHSFFTYAIRIPNRDELAKYLLKNDIYSTLRYHPLNNYKHFNKSSGDYLQNTEILNKTALSLPLHPRLTDIEVSKIIDCILKFYQ
jgi:dTDP-4-amino-4,6-dideoxygalactose transaminase